MASKLISFFLGAAFGAGLCALVWNSRSQHALQQAVTVVREEHAKAQAEWESELNAERARTKAARDDTDRMAARVEELNLRMAALKPAGEPPKKKSGFAALFGGDGTNDNSAAFSGMMKAAIEQQIDGKVSGMKLRLNLTPDQEAAVREIVGKQLRRGTEMAEKMMKGELNMEEAQEMSKNANPVSEKEQIKALLTPDQQLAYDAFEKEENQRMARLMANSELLQLQGALHLDEGQQDKVYAVLAEQAQSQFDGTTGGFDLGRISDKKAEALKAVLSPEQFEQYKKFQEQQQKMIEAFMPKSGTNSGIRSSVIIRAGP